MVDVTSFSKIQDEKRGVNEKHWIDINGRAALFKKTQIRENGIHTNAHFSEVLASDICKKIGANCAEVDIAKNGNDIGCVSYSFLDSGDELIDFIALIQNIRIGFDSKKMEVDNTGEKYSIPLILEALEEECNTKEEFNILRKEFLRSCIVDSLIEHYDRNPSNIAIIRNKNGIRFSPMFDNGTSLWVSIPLDVVRENIDREEWLQEIRERNKSKIGVEGERYSNYDKLLEYILSNYYSDVKDFLDTIKTELTADNISRILSDEKYSDLDEMYKQLIIKKLSTNREKLLEQRKKYQLKYQIEELMEKDNARETLLSMVKDGTMQQLVPEIESCIDCPQRNPYHIYNVDEYMFTCIENVNRLEELGKEAGITIKLSDKDKKLLQWVILFNEMGKPDSRETIRNEDGSIRDTFRNYSKIGREIADKKMEELHFYETERDTVRRLISIHDKRELDSDYAIKRFIEGLDEKNLDLYFAMKLVEINAKNPDIREESINKLKALKQRIEEIQKKDNRNIIRVLPQNGKKMMKLGLKGPQIGMLQQELANFVRADERMPTY